MKNEQTLLLLTLAKKIKKGKTSKESAIVSLNSAGIITKKGEMTKSFPNLKRLLSVSE